MKQAIFAVIFGLVWLFPVLYAYKHRVSNKMLFLFSAYGAEIIINSLLIGVGMPLYIFSIYMLPQLTELNSQYRLLGLPMYWAMEYFWLVTPLLLFVIPRGIHARYRRFFSSETHT